MTREKPLRKRRKPLTRGRLGTWTLENIAALLNSDPAEPELRDELRQLFKRYRDSGPNLQRMMATDKQLERTLRGMWEVRCVFTDSGFCDLELLPKALDESDPYDTSYKAAQIFGRLIMNSGWAKLDGPCSWCKKYFVRQRRSFRTKEHVYCSRQCSAVATATASTKAVRDDVNKAKLKKAEAAAQRWKPGGISFKEFVHQQAGLTKTWITQAINRRELLEPK